MVSFYCLKCKKHIEVDAKDTKLVALKNGRLALQSVCPTCGMKLSKFVSKEEAHRVHSQSGGFLPLLWLSPAMLGMAAMSQKDSKD
jgi:DNA-directed RNA polymerase subunit RPC12/RpoP